MYKEFLAKLTGHLIVDQLYLNRLLCALVVSISDADEFMPLGYITLFANRCVCVSCLSVCVCVCVLGR